jgi:hypothetical protein
MRIVRPWFEAGIAEFAHAGYAERLSTANGVRFLPVPVLNSEWHSFLD